jgi:tripartite-type tricarboxylate transporter receptor subunit TctC
MRMNRLTRSLGSLLLGCAIWTLPMAAFAEYPDKPIRLIVPQAAGSATDTVARILAAELGPQLGGVTIVVEDKPGAAFTIGLDLVAKAAPDGYTVGIGPIGALAISPNMVPKLPYVIEKDLQPIALIVHGHLMLVVSPKSDIKSVQELIAKAKANPGRLTNASSANGSPGHVGGELFKFMTGTQIQHVPYRGGSAATTDLIAGHVDLMFESLNSIAPMAKSGEVRGLGVSGDKRSTAFPDIPTIAEAGVPGYSAPTWTGLIGPAGLPPAILEKLNASVNRAIRSPGFLERFSKIGDEPAGGTPKDFADTIAKDTAKWKDVVARSGAKLD